METEAQAATAPYTPAASSIAPAPELIQLIAETSRSLRGAARRAVLAILDEYIDEWLYSLRPLPYIPNLAVEVSERTAWIPEIVEKLGPGVIAEAMSLALEAVNAHECSSLLPRLTSIEEALIEASGIEPGEAIRTAMESGDCRTHAALIAHLVAVKPVGGAVQ